MDPSNANLNNLMLHSILPNVSWRDLRAVALTCRAYAAIVRKQLLWELVWRSQFRDAVVPQAFEFDFLWLVKANTPPEGLDTFPLAAGTGKVKVHYTVQYMTLHCTPLLRYTTTLHYSTRHRTMRRVV